MGYFKTDGLASSLLLITATFMVASSLPSFSAQAANGVVLKRRALHNKDSYTVLNAGASGQVLGYSMGHARDRLQVHIRFDSGGATPEDAWVHYRPYLSDRRQAIQLYDASNRATSDVSQAKTFMTLKAGVSAWVTMEHVQGELQTFNQENPPMKNTLERKTASAMTSTQALIPGASWAVDCEDFIDSDGNYGNYGETLYNILGGADTYDIVNSKVGDMSTICPGYSNFDDAGKKNFWIWFAAAVSMAESSCNPEEINRQAMNATAVGLWQLDGSLKNAVQRERCGDRLNLYSGVQNISCAVKMFNFYTEIWNTNTRKLAYFSKNYWETLHVGSRSHAIVVRLMRQYRACR